MQSQLNLPSASSQRLPIVTTSANDPRSEKPTKPGAYEAESEGIFDCLTYAPVLLRAKCTKAEPAEVLYTLSGPNIPKPFADDVEVLRYVSFAVLSSET